MRRLLATAMVGLLTLGAGAALAACGGDDDSGAAPEIEIDEETGRVTIDGQEVPDPSCEGRPEDLPGAVPLPDLEADTCSHDELPGETVWAFWYEGADTESLAAYRDALVTNGFAITQDSTDDGGAEVAQVAATFEGLTVSAGSGVYAGEPAMSIIVSLAVAPTEE